MKSPLRASAALLVVCLSTCSLVADTSSLRETPAVRAVRRARVAVVNIRSEKSASRSADFLYSRGSRKVNGMGTGVVIDERGYIVTNYHVVAGVDSLQVTLPGGSIHQARVVSYDRDRDLAIIRVKPSRPLTTMPLGTSSDLMLAETVFAVGNAYGYEDTVTSGIISSLSRDVVVNDKQTYRNLIQTDASINPGNSGGPLINLDGEVVGINVAVRAGAQRIGFAIPIDDAREVIAKLLSIERLCRTWHGLVTRDVKRGTDRRLVVRSTRSDSPAAAAGFKAGDVVTRVGELDIVDAVDFERALLERRAGSQVDVRVQRDGQTVALSLVLATAPGRDAPEVVLGNQLWSQLGLKVEPIGREDLHRAHGTGAESYNGGLKVVGLRPKGPAREHGIRNGDVLVGLHDWETINLDNVRFLLDHPRRAKFSPLKFYILRGNETLYGHLPVASPSE